MGQRIGPVVLGGTNLSATRSHSFVGAPREAVHVHRRSFLSNKHHIGPQMTARPKHATAKARDEITNGLCFGCAMMKPVRTIELTHAVPFERGPGHRTPQTLLLIDERDKLLVEAAKFFPGALDREISRRLRAALSIYRAGRWRRDCAELTCPPQHRGKLVQVLWLLLKTMDAIPGDKTVRNALARPAIRCPPPEG
jgi:hypothetical protein